MPQDLKKILREEKITIYEVERYCNNYFNPTNSPNDKKRNYPDAFLDLVGRIVNYKNSEGAKNNFASETFDDYSYAQDFENNSWQKLFARELSIYKRTKFI